LIGSQSPNSPLPTDGGTLVVGLQADAKRLLVGDTQDQLAFTGRRTGLQFGIELGDVWILAEELKTFASSFMFERRLRTNALPGFM
jgi:hypothetical protein